MNRLESESLFDITGRVIPPRGVKTEKENKIFHFDQVDTDDKECLKQGQEYLPNYKFPSLMEFQHECGVIKERALQHLQIGQNAFVSC